MNGLASSVLIVTVVFLATATCVVILRLFSQRFIVHRVRLHDYVMLLGWLYTSGMCAAICYGTTQGLGLNQVQLVSSQRSKLAKAIYAFSILYNPAHMAIKSSILLFYLQLAKGIQNIRIAIYITFAVVNAAGFALMLVNIFQCRPVNDALVIFVHADRVHCIDLVALYLASAPVNILTNVAIFCLPLPILRQLRLPRRQKAILVVTFSTGLFDIIVSVIRIIYLEDAVTTRAATVLVSANGAGTVAEYNLSWIFSSICLWSAVEVNLGIICGSVPCLKPFASRFFPLLIQERRVTTAIGRAISPQKSRRARPESSSQPSSTGEGQPPTGPPKSSPNVTVDHNNGSVKELTSSQGRGQAQSGSGTSPHTSHRATFFDFISRERKTNMLEFTARESLIPLCMISVLFFFTGFIFGFQDDLNAEFRMIAGYPLSTSFELHATFFCGFALSPILIALPILRQAGFKETLITGLSICSCGLLAFWPSAVLVSLPAFFVSNFIVGCGSAVVETAIKLFVVVCGPTRLSEIRLNVVNGVLAVGSTISPFLAERVLFRDAPGAPELVNVQWIYLALALFGFLLAVICYYLPIPEMSEEDLDKLRTDPRRGRSSLCGVEVIWVTLAMGVFARFCYSGAHECLITKFRTLISDKIPNPEPAVDTLFAISNALSSAGNFTTAFMQCFIEPRWVLAFLAVGAIVFSTLAMNLTGYAGIAVVLVVFFVEGGILVTTFAICVRGMGRHTKMAASVLITALVGGAPFPVIQNYVHASQSAQYAVCVTVALFASGSTLSLYLNLVAPARRQVDRRIELHRTQAPQMTSSVTEPPEITSSCGVLSVHESDDQNPDAITRSSV